MDAKPKVLVLCDYYLPGFKSGGGMRTIVNMVTRLHQKYEFNIVTRDHDGKLDRTPYRGVKIDAWNDVGPARVHYLSSQKIRPGRILELFRSVKPDLVYTNSYFSTLAVFGLLNRRMGRFDKVPFVVAPCGELASGALTVKPLKKRVYRRLAKVLRLYKAVVWKASSEIEQNEIRELEGGNVDVLVAPDLPPETIFEDYSEKSKPEKSPGSVRLCFVGRFARNKNLKQLIPVLRDVEGTVDLDIIGPIEDQGYWEEFEAETSELPEAVTIRLVGSLPNEELPMKLAEYHFFVSMTLGENFGHSLLESLAAGTPIVISDRTPWRDLEEKGIGWDIPLEDPLGWKRAVQRCIDMDDAEFRRTSHASRQYAVNWLSKDSLTEQTEALLDHALVKGDRKR